MDDSQEQTNVLALTAEIVVAQVGNNPMGLAELPDLIRSVFRTLSTMGTEASVPPRPAAAAPIKKSITPDYLICLEDGKKFKMLKRHLRTAFNLTPEQYRERWGLAPDYPMVAPNYAKRRSQLARELGLGTKAKRGRPR